MKKVNYRTTTILGRLLICVGFIITGVLLILASFFLEVSTARKVISWVAGIVGILFETPAYILNTMDGERVYIPTFYVISKKDYSVILQTLKDIVSDRTKR